jgi:hypothetical protein
VTVPGARIAAVAAIAVSAAISASGLLNLAIGGNSGGDPSKTAFPARFEVDYVRVYQTAEQRR